MKDKRDLLTLAPMEAYKAPDIPTLAKVKPASLQKVPNRWKNKAVIAVATGILGATTLTGCAAPIPSFTPVENTGEPIPAPDVNRLRAYCDISDSIHFGGASSAPIYVAYLTEQDALNLIGQQFAAAGISLEEALPRPRINAEDIHFGNEWDFWFRDVEPGDSGTMFPNYVEMQLIDETSGTGIVLIKNWEWGRWSCQESVQASIEQRFQREHGISVEVIFENGGEFGPGSRAPEGVWDLYFEYGVTDEVRDILLEQAEERLIEQVDDLIVQLRENGMID